MGIADHWNTRAEDLEDEWVCDTHAPDVPDAANGPAALYRAVDVAAPAAIVWRWLCQLSEDPYSYDWIDNRGRKSPSQLTPGLERLEIGQTVMSIFRLVGFAAEDQLTLKVDGFLGLGPLYVTYRVREREGRTRLAAKLSIGRRPGLLGAVLLRGLAMGDWIMMRKQLLTLKAHAEATARDGAAGAPPAAR